MDAALRAGGHITGVIGTVGTQDRRRGPPGRPDHAGGARPARPAGGHARARCLSGDHGGVQPCAGAGPGRRRALRRRGVHQPEPGPPGLPRRHGGLLRGQGQLFTAGRAAAGLVCVDDEWGRRLAARRRSRCTTYAAGAPADWTVARRPAQRRPGPAVHRRVGPAACDVPAGVACRGLQRRQRLAALAAAVHRGVDPARWPRRHRRCSGVPGRMERMPPARRSWPSSTTRTPRTRLNGRSRATREVIDRAGDRRCSAAAGTATGTSARDGRGRGREADVLVITDDNPRSERPRAIRAAIWRALAVHGGRGRGAGRGRPGRGHRIARRRWPGGDAVLVLGKGHEQGQEAAGVVAPFDDRVAARGAGGVADQDGTRRCRRPGRELVDCPDPSVPVTGAVADSRLAGAR